MSNQRALVLGLGNIGGALAQALIRGGYEVAAWNRSDKSGDASRIGIQYHWDVEEALERSDIVFSCLASYKTAADLLTPLAESGILEDKVFIQLSTGMANEAATFETFIQSMGAHYLDGKIAVVPGSIGTNEAVIFYAGSKATFDAARPLIHCIAGSSVHVGDDVRASSHADFSFLAYFFLSTLGVLYGTAFCRAAGLDERQFHDLLPNFSKDISDRAVRFRDALQRGDFTHDVDSTISVDLNGARMMAATAAGLGLWAPPMNFVVDCFAAAAERGFSSSDTSVLIPMFENKDAVSSSKD